MKVDCLQSRLLFVVILIQIQAMMALTIQRIRDMEVDSQTELSQTLPAIDTETHRLVAYLRHRCSNTNLLSCYQSLIEDLSNVQSYLNILDNQNTEQSTAARTRTTTTTTSSPVRRRRHRHRRSSERLSSQGMSLIQHTDLSLSLVYGDAAGSGI